MADGCGQSASRPGLLEVLPVIVKVFIGIPLADGCLKIENVRSPQNMKLSHRYPTQRQLASQDIMGVEWFTGIPRAGG
ncbi:hypothetical protein GB937_010065 [Aspergillus fischeri]|nr:hypothetical protein GB937_010065 [Aspergillus fischeri]